MVPARLKILQTELLRSEDRSKQRTPNSTEKRHRKDWLSWLAVLLSSRLELQQKLN